MSRVLHIHSGNLFGGVERMLASIAATPASADSSHAFALCVEGRVSAELRAREAAVVMLGDTRIRNPFSIHAARTRLRHHLESVRYTAVVCHGAWALALFGAVIRKAGIRLVLFLHDRPARDWLDHWARRTRPDVLICNSAHTRDAARHFFEPLTATVVHPPLAHVTAGEPAGRAMLRAELGAQPGDVVIIQVSRMQAWKGQAVLLQALAALRDVSGWRAWIVGGPQRKSEVRVERSLESLIEDLGLNARVRLLGERTDVPSLLGAADIYCQPNTTPEPFGLSLVEAMAAGLPVVTSDMGGAREIVNAETGILVPASDPAAIAAALATMIADAARRTALGSAGPARATQLCDPARNLAQLTAAIARVQA